MFENKYDIYYDGYSAALKQFAKNAQSFLFDKEFCVKALELYTTQIGNLAKQSEKSYDYSAYFNAMATLEENFVKNIEAIYRSVDFSAIEMTCAYLKTLSDRPNSSLFLDIEPLDNILDSIEEAAPFMTQEQHQLCKSTFEQPLNRKLSLGDLVAILSLLFSILSFLISQLPNDQLDILIEQQSIQIETEHQENEALLKAISSLTTTVEQLSSEIELLQEQIDDLTDLDLKNDELEDSDSLNDIADTEN